MNQDNLFQAIGDLREQGFKVTKKDRGYIPAEAQRKIEEDLNFYEDILKDRLEALGLTTTDLENVSSFEIYREGRYKGHEVQSLGAAMESVAAARDALRDGRVFDLVHYAVFLGWELPDGIAPHQYDEKRNSRMGAAKGGNKSKRKPWADALAKELCHLTDDEIAFEFESNQDGMQIKTTEGYFDVYFQEDPKKLTPFAEAVPSGNVPKLPQTLTLSSFVRYYVRPARKNQP